MSTAQPDPWINARYERKFVADMASFDDMLLLVKTHPGCFVSPYPDRFINNIYLDTPDYQFYRANRDGIAIRKKVRIRWYGDFPQARSPRLEIKLKQGQMGIKQMYSLPDFELGHQHPVLADLFAQADLPLALAEDLKRLRPSVCNRYRRAYFVMSAQAMRLTVDGEIHSSPFPKHPRWNVHRDPPLIELKYPRELEDGASIVSGYLPFRLSRNSKYINAMNALHLVLPD